MSAPAISLAERLCNFRELAKSGIVTLVVISVVGGFLVGQPSEAPFYLDRLGLAFFGILLLSAGSSALNQIQERAVDARMPRTANRPLPAGKIPLTDALAFVVASIFTGLFLLALLNREQLILGLLAVFSYNGLYTLWWKRRWAYAAVPGAIPGALPILMGYAAASGEIFSPAGLYLFFILFFWQMPHFWTLALRYRKDYELGAFPTLPVALGEPITVLQITLWSLAYVGLGLVAPFFLRVGSVYLLIALPTCAKLLWELRSFVKQGETVGEGKGWLRFFLWVNFSLIIFVFAAALDLWSHFIMAPIWTR